MRVRVYGTVFRTVLARGDAERVHRASLRGLRVAAALPGGGRGLRWVCGADVPSLRVSAMGLQFPNPFGLAAGFDKNGEAVDALAALGFGFVEVGTVTALPQPGNPRPRLSRLPRDRAVINRMGFNNDGAAAVARRLARRRAGRGGLVVGVNIGRSRATPDEEAVDDYVTSTTLLAPVADYLVVNVSSPNTPGLRDLQAADRLRPLLNAVGEAAGHAAGANVPLLVKIAPDLADDDINAVAELAGDLGLDGIVATNTTLSREGLATPAAQVAAAGSGGLSGAPLKERSLAVLRLLRERVGDRLTLVSVGGVETPDDAWERLRAGATLVQAYTGLVYGGPLWPGRVLAGLAERSARLAVGDAAP